MADETKAAAAKKSGPFKVVDAGNRNRVLMETEDEDEARGFVVTNAPRTHVENGVPAPSVYLVPPGPFAAAEYWNGGEWVKEEQS